MTDAEIERLMLALRANKGNVRAAAREAKVSKDAAHRYVTKLKAKGEYEGPTSIDQVDALIVDVEAFLGRLRRLRADMKEKDSR